MKHIKTSQNTFGKKTQKQIKALAPTTKCFKKVGNGYLAKSAEGETVATWSPRHMTTGLIVLW